MNQSKKMSRRQRVAAILAGGVLAGSLTGAAAGPQVNDLRERLIVMKDAMPGCVKFMSQLPEGNSTLSDFREGCPP